MLQGSEKVGLPEAVGEPGDRRVAPFLEESDEGRLLRGEFYSGGDVCPEADPFFPFRPDGRTIQALTGAVFTRPPVLAGVPAVVLAQLSDATLTDISITDLAVRPRRERP